MNERTTKSGHSIVTRKVKMSESFLHTGGARGSRAYGGKKKPNRVSTFNVDMVLYHSFVEKRRQDDKSYKVVVGVLTDSEATTFIKCKEEEIVWSTTVADVRQAQLLCEAIAKWIAGWDEVPLEKRDRRRLQGVWLEMRGKMGYTGEHVSLIVVTKASRNGNEVYWMGEHLFTINSTFSSLRSTCYEVADTGLHWKELSYAVEYGAKSILGERPIDDNGEYINE